MASDRQVRGLFCVKCGAKPGMRCFTSSGRKSPFHVDRLALADDLINGRISEPMATALRTAQQSFAHPAVRS